MGCPKHPDAGFYKKGYKRPVCAECRLESKRRSYDRYGQSLRTRYTSMRASAVRRGIPFELTFEDFRDIVSQSCVYSIHDKETESQVITIGIDRGNSALGYVVSNCFPCCPRHNEIKSDVFTHEQMIDVAYRYQIQCGNTRAGRKKGPRVPSPRSKPRPRNRQPDYTAILRSIDLPKTQE